MSARIGIGFLGGGMIAQIGHIPFYVCDDRCHVVAIAESRRSLVGHLEALAPGARVVRSHDELLGDPAIDAVVISAPRAATGPLTFDALRAGKHVLAEKPMAHTAEQGRKLTEAARDRQRLYAVGFMKRCDPGIIAAKALYDSVTESGRLGRLRFARFFDHSKSYAVPPPPHKRPAESRAERFATWPTAPDWLPRELHEPYAWFMNAGSHDVNLLRHFFGDAITLLDALAPNSDVVAASFEGPDGCAVSLEVSRVACGRWIEGVELYFETGSISVAIPSPMATDRESEVRFDDGKSGIVAERVPAERGWCFRRQARAFVDALDGSAPLPTSGEDGLADIVLIESMWKQIAGLS